MKYQRKHHQMKMKNLKTRQRDVKMSNLRTIILVMMMKLVMTLSMTTMNPITLVQYQKETPHLHLLIKKIIQNIIKNKHLPKFLQIQEHSDCHPSEEKKHNVKIKISNEILKSLVEKV